MKTKGIKTIWIGTIDGIFGYGITIASKTESDCMKALELAYNDWVDARIVHWDDTDDYGEQFDNEGNLLTRFQKAFEAWGGTVKPINLDQAYFDNFKD